MTSRRALLFVVTVMLISCRDISAWAEREEIFEIAPATVTCTGVAVRQCLQVRSRADEPWQYFYGHIEGFTYEPGYLYAIRVAVRPIPNPPADGSDREYRLLEILSKVRAP